MKILIIEDDSMIRTLLKSELEKWQYQVFVINDFNQIIEQVKQVNPHLILLDITLPSYNGFHWSREIRRFSKVPIMFISARDTIMDQIMAIEMGGDDYLVKPLDLPLTIAKIQALLRRSYEMGNYYHEIKYQSLTLHLSRLELSDEDSPSLVISLTKTETILLEQLMRQPEQFVSRNLLIEKLWENENFIDDNTLSVNMTRLRKKLQSLNGAHWIKTKRNVGYAIEK